MSNDEHGSHSGQASAAFSRPEIAAVFEAHPAPVRERLLDLRALILETAEQTEGVGDVEETLKWGQPAYVTADSKSGTTIRIDSKSPEHYALYVHCQTDLIRRVRKTYPKLQCVGNREIAFAVTDDLPEREVREVVVQALTYHRRR